ncbi:hypothetical protein J1N35_041322 [Gossypium stocksii]|uniref:Uncharacterized protein n=1 Tax=Gossypium stocksii TaxID=47602 RepID=A0A9D3UFR7_9ROSI|nr:hypothetical protein J1N35_041322 [Gossypium stocksii]
MSSLSRDGVGPSSTNIATNARTEAEAESSTTGLCGRFIALLQNSDYDVLKSSMGTHSLISTLATIISWGISVTQTLTPRHDIQSVQLRKKMLVHTKRVADVHGSEPEQVPTDPEPFHFDDNDLDNARDPNPQFRAYEPLTDMYNIDLSIEGGLEFS